MEHYSSIIFCSGRTFKSSAVVVSVLSILLVMMLSFLFLLTNSFAYVEVRQQKQEQQQDQLQLRDTPAATITTIEVIKQNLSLLHQNVPNLKYDYNSSSSLKAFSSELGTEPKSNNNWITINHDIYGTRSSNQTIINKDNVNRL